MTRSTPHQQTGFLGYEVDFPRVAHIVADLDDLSISAPIARRPGRTTSASTFRRIASAMRAILRQRRVASLAAVAAVAMAVAG